MGYYEKVEEAVITVMENNAVTWASSVGDYDCTNSFNQALMRAVEYLCDLELGMFTGMNII